MITGPPPAAQALRAAGLRATAQRAAVLEVLRAASRAAEHLPAAEVAGRARSVLGSLSVQATYDCLDALVDAQLARRIRPAGATGAVYEAGGPNHHHVVCRGCGATADVECAVGAAPCLTPSELPAGFALDEAEVTFWGWCAECGTHDPEPLTVPAPDHEPTPLLEEIR